MYWLCRLRCFLFTASLSTVIAVKRNLLQPPPATWSPLLWHGRRTMPLLRPKVSSSPDHLRDIDSVSRSALCGRQWDAVWVAKTGAWRMHRERKRRPAVGREWRGLETAPQRGWICLLSNELQFLSRPWYKVSVNMLLLPTIWTPWNGSCHKQNGRWHSPRNKVCSARVTLSSTEFNGATRIFFPMPACSAVWAGASMPIRTTPQP